MFDVILNEQINSIQVKNNDENNSVIVAEGQFEYDGPDRTLVVLFHHVTIAPDNIQQLDEFLSTVISYMDQFHKPLICLRFPAIFDNRINLDKLEFKNEISAFMAVTVDHMKYSSDNLLQNIQEQYELITDKQLILNYNQQLLRMMNIEAFWSKKWDLEEMRARINSATNNAMILDKINNVPCGFGRLFLLTTDDEIFGYLSDIAVDSSHQSKGLGRVIVNYLVGISVNQDSKQRDRNGTLCLQCANEGSGALSAPKLYKRSGFEFVNDIGNRITIFARKKYDEKTSEE